MNKLHIKQFKSQTITQNKKPIQYTKYDSDGHYRLIPSSDNVRPKRNKIDRHVFWEILWPLIILSTCDEIYKTVACDGAFMVKTYLW